MEPTKKNRSLLRSRVAKKRGNPIFVSSQPILIREPVPIIILEPKPLTSVEVITPEQSYLSIDGLTALTNKQKDTTGEDFSDSTESGTLRPQLKRLRTNDDILRDKCDKQESFVASLPLFALEKRLDFGLRYSDNRCCPCTMAVTGEIHPKKISPSVANPSSESGNGLCGGMSIFEAFDTAFNNKWGLGNVSREAYPEVESSSSDDIASEESNGNQLRAEESSNVIEDVDDERRTREKRACRSVFDLVRLMELRRIGLVKPPKNPVKHVQLIDEIRECTANLRNKFSNDGTTAQVSSVFEMSPVVNQKVTTVEDFEPIPVEDSCSTVEYNEEATSVDTALEDVNIFANMTSLTRKDNEDDASYERPILKRRTKQPNSWQNVSEKSRDDLGIPFKDRLNPIAAAEYDEMDVIELDIYDELPNQFRSDVPKEFTRRWSTQDTEKFYKCIALLGLDFGRIATVMKRTQKQITNKFKTEQKKNNERLHDALIRQGEFFEYRKKYRF